MNLEQEIRKMDNTNLRKRARGQGLVEYAFILALVALVAIIIIGVLGLGVQRLYGLAAGALAKHEIAGVLTFTEASCYVDKRVAGSYATALYVTGMTNIPLTNLMGSTTKVIGTDGYGAPSPLNLDQVNGTGAIIPGSFRFNPFMSGGSGQPGAVADPTLCPASVVILRNNVVIAFSPITIKYLP